MSRYATFVYFRARPAAVTTLACEQELQAACHCGWGYEETLKHLSNRGMWVSHDTWHKYCLRYNAQMNEPRLFNNSNYMHHRYEMFVRNTVRT